MKRSVQSRYEDPLDTLWIATARSMGLTVKREKSSYASTDGRGTLFISDEEGMDEDDCLAQMIFHEICHFMVQGPQSIGWVDWGLDNETQVDDELEHACLRLQAVLLMPYGLRQTLAPTTDFRAYYDALPPDPFEEKCSSEREAIVRARAAYARRRQLPFRNHLERALESTARILHETRSVLGDAVPPDTLYATIEERPALHSVGLPLFIPLADGAAPTCAQCAWSYAGGETILHCRQADGSSVEKCEAACERFEKVFDCVGCGACCREAYDTVEVSERDPAKKRHLNLMVKRTGGYDMARDGSRCICLKGGLALRQVVPSIHGGLESSDAADRLPPLNMPGGQPFTCDIYETRPHTCRDFTIFSQHCLNARRTVGLSR